MTLAETTLSICIPTYNRAKALDRLLSNICTETEALEENVEVCISDNCSPDETQTIVKKWATKLQIVYKRNPKNVGFDLNVIGAVKLATGKFIWLSGDDDVFFEGAIANFLSDLKTIGNEDVGAIYLAGKEDKTCNNLDFEKFTLFQPENLPYLEDLSFMGCIAFKRDTALDVINKSIEVRDGKTYKTEFKTTVMYDFMHTYLFVECMKRSKLVGVAPRYGIRKIDDGNEFTQKRYIKMLLRHIEYVRHLRDYYGQYEALLPKKRYSRFLVSFFRYFLLYGTILSQNEELEGFYQLQYRLLYTMIKKEKRNDLLPFLEIMNRCRRNKLFIFSIVLAFKAFKRIKRNNIPEVGVKDMRAVSEEIYAAFKDEIDTLPEFQKDNYDEAFLDDCLSHMLYRTND
jgi:glycosyltransferase involved in cell wall biosynthesis